MLLRRLAASTPSGVAGFVTQSSTQSDVVLLLSLLQVLLDPGLQDSIGSTVLYGTRDRACPIS